MFTQTTQTTIKDTRAALLSLLNLHIWGEFDKTFTSVATVLEPRSENNSYTCKLRL